VTEQLSIFSAPHIIFLPDSALAAEMDVRLSRVSPGTSRRATCFVFRAPDSLVDSLAKPNEIGTREAVIWRANRKPVCLLTYNRAKSVHEMYYVGLEGLRFIDEASAVASVRQSDLEQVIATTEQDCYLLASPTYHFVTPSHRHTSLFLRVGDAIRSLEILDRLAFWLLPIVDRADGILVDHWSISPVVMRALLSSGRHIPFDCLTGHPRLDKQIATTSLEKLLSVSSSEPRIRCIVSVTGSGSLVSLLKETSADHHLVVDDDTVCCLYGFMNNQAVPVMCRIPHTTEDYPSEEECQLCKNDSTPIQVDPRLYYVRSFKENDVVLTKAHLSLGREFFGSREAVAGGLRVHRNDPNDGRHHAFDIDVLAVLTDDAFLAEYQRRLELIERPEVVIVPDHQAGRRMATIAAEVYGGVPVIVHGNLRIGTGLSAEHAKVLKQAQRVIIIDDVMNSGTRLNEYNKALREQFGPFESVTFLVGVARTESAAEWEENRIALTTNHPWQSRLLCVDRAYLPRWDELVCPWCHELDFLSGVSEKLTRPPDWLIDRIDLLSRRGSGVLEEPLLILPGVSSKRLGSGSPVGPEGLSSTRTLFAIASALQQLRNDDNRKKRLDPRFPDSNVFGRNNLNNYSEGLLRAVILRLIRPHEWGSANRAPLRRDLCAMARKLDQDILLGEFVLASARGSVPPFGRQFFRAVYSKYLGDVCEAFSNALHL
jgi:hypothetical protein